MPTPEAQIRTYLDAAQTALSAGEYASAKLQVRLARMELAKIPVDERHFGLEARNRQLSEMDSIIADIDAAQDEAGSYRLGGRTEVRRT